MIVDSTQAIKNVVLSYVELLDLGDLEGISDLFRDTVVMVDGSDDKIQGADALRGFIERTVQFYDGIPSTKHVVTNLIVEINEERSEATARSYYTAFQARPELPLQAVLAGRFHDELEFDGQRWHIATRTIFTDLVGDLRYHIRGFEGT